MSILSAEALHLMVGSRTLLADIHLSLHKGELLGILGANGAGKTSLLRLLMGAQRPTSGRVQLDGRSLNDWPGEARAKRLAYLAQGHSVHWPLPVREVVALGRLPHGDAERASGRLAVDEAMACVGVSTLAGQQAQFLSGGERARVMLARALATQPTVLLADEPLAALDPAHQLQIMALLRDQAQQGRAVALVLHDLTLAARFCTRVLVLHQGRILTHGQPDQVLDAATLAHAYGIEALDIAHGGERCLLPWRLASPPIFSPQGVIA